MTENEITIDLYDIFRKLFQIILRTWKIAAAVIIAAAAATVWYVHVSYVPMYETKAAFAVSRELNGEKNYLYNKNAAEELSVSFESILYSDVMQDAMKEQLGTNVLPAQIIFGKIGTTNLFTVSAQSQDPDSAEQVIQAFLDNYARVFRASLMEISLEVIENPEPAVIFNSPQYLRKLTYVCGALVLLYAVLAGVYALLRRTISEEEEVRDYLRTECLGTLPYAKISGKEEKMPLITKDGSRYYEMKEAAGGIRRRMEKQKERDASCAYLIAGASEHEGVSTAAANLALSLAYRGWKTALADLNLRKPSQMERFSGKESGVKKLAMNISGTDIYAEKTELTENLAVYGAVHPVSDTAEILASQKMQHFLDGLKERYDYLIIDSPPLLAFADAQTLAKAADTSLFVIREDRLPASSLMEAMELLNEAAPHVLGCVINGSRIHISKYGYGYGYGYSYGYKYRYGYGYRRRYGYVRAGQDGKRKQPEMKNI